MKRNEWIKTIALWAVLLSVAALSRSAVVEPTEAHGSYAMGFLRVFRTGEEPEPDGESAIGQWEDETPGEESPEANEEMPTEGEGPLEEGEGIPEIGGEASEADEEAPETGEETPEESEEPSEEDENLPMANAPGIGSTDGRESEPEQESAEESPAAQSPAEQSPPLAEPIEEAAEVAEGISGDLFVALSPSEAVVKTYDQLKTALSNDNGITTVYFGDNITMKVTGVRVHPNKSHVVVSGINPLDPEQSRPYTLTDAATASFYDTVYINAAGVQSLTVRDLTITGKNFYGPFSVYDSDLLAGVVLTYERVDYNGPQFGYHRQGTVHIRDCDVRIHGANGGSENQEFSEVKHLVFEGDNTIDTSTSLYSIFWHPFGGTFRIADDASLTLTSPNTSGTYGTFYADGPAYKIELAIGRRAVFDATISGSVSARVFAQLSGLTVREGGRFSLTTTTATANRPILTMEGAITVEKDAVFTLYAYGGSALYGVLRQEDGDITVGKDATFHVTSEHASPYLLNLYERALYCDDPASILFYNAGRNISATDSEGWISVDAQQVNYWESVSAGGLDNPPMYRWERSDQTNFVLSGALKVGDAGNFTSLSNNYLPGDPPGVAPSPSTFSMVRARTLAFGRLELTVSTPTIESTAIHGATRPGATVRASFVRAGAPVTLPDAVADAEGLFHIPTGTALAAGTVVEVKSGWQHLTAKAEVTVGGEGVLTLFVPETLEFFTTELSSHDQMVRRRHPGWEVLVSDTRGGGEGWSLYARLDSEMTAPTAEWPVLRGALVFIDASGDVAVMHTGEEQLVYKREPDGEQEFFAIGWEESRGILLRVKPGTAFADAVYTASVSWTLVDGP